MKDRLYIATVCRNWAPLAHQYGLGVELDQFCTAENMDPPKREETCRQAETLLQTAFPEKDEKSRRVTFHAPFNELHPAAIDPKAKALAVERLEQGAELAQSFGAQKMIVHSGYIPFVYFEQWQVARSVEFWEAFMEGKPEGFQIVVENVLESAPDMLVDMMKEIQNPAIRLCLDVGHASCMSDLPAMKWLEVMLPWLGHLHIHNNDGTHDWHGPLERGTVPMEGLLETFLEKAPADATVTIETLEPESSLEWLSAKGFL